VLEVEVHCSDCVETFVLRVASLDSIPQLLRRSVCPSGHAFLRDDGTPTIAARFWSIRVLRETDSH
jgi:hypothetical protein